MLVLMFPGQGSQRAGMGAPWQGHSSWQLVGRLASQAGADIAHLLVSAEAEELRATANAQLATYALSTVVLGSLRARLGLSLPRVLVGVAGHSLGEYSALVAAGALEAEEGARLVQARGRSMQSAADARPGTMAAIIGLGLEEVAQSCAQVQDAWVANDNAPGQVVISGTKTGVEAAGKVAVGLGAKRVIPLQVGGAFHSPLMAPAQDRLDAALAAAVFKAPGCPVIANVDAQAHTEGFSALLSAQLCSRVRWRESLLTLAGMGARLFVELGPGTELSGMARRTVPDVPRANLATPEDLDSVEKALEALAGRDHPGL